MKRDNLYTASKPMTEAQFNSMLTRLQLIVQRTQCTNDVALELFDVCALAVLIDIHGNDCEQIAGEIVSRAAVRAAKVLECADRKIVPQNPGLKSRVKRLLRRVFKPKPLAQPIMAQLKEAVEQPKLELAEAKPRIVVPPGVSR
jgi:hypothetical protein